MSSLTRALLMGGLLVGGLAYGAAALTVGLTSEAQLTGAITTLDFESGVVNGPGMSFESGATIVSGADAGAAHSGLYVLHEPSPHDTGPDMEATFTSGVFQVGLWFGNDDGRTDYPPAFTVTLSAYDVSDSLLGSTSLAANINDAHDQFIGIASSDLIYRVLLDYGVGSSELYGSIDDFSYGGDPVPEPASVTLLALGLAGMAARRLRRK